MFEFEVVCFRMVVCLCFDIGYVGFDFCFNIALLLFWFGLGWFCVFDIVLGLEFNW